MRRTVWYAITIASVAALLLFAVPGAGDGRGETILAWDDGTAENSTTGNIGIRVAVGFYAPEGNCGLVGLKFYSVDDGLENPIDPQLPTTRPFTVWVWRVASGWAPGAPANDGFMPFTDDYEYPEDAWVDVTLPEPVDLSNPAHFPDGEFFVGIEWEYRNSPYIGLDLDPPISGESWLYDWFTWAPCDTANIMIRAVVCDSTASPVELESWGTVKSLYR